MIENHKIAFLFPGQGSQVVGMGKAFHDASPAARAVFEEANAALGFDLRGLMFEGPESELALTANTQPAVLTASVAAAAACAERGLTPALTAGHSLGEYSALVVSGAVRMRDAVRVVRQRGEVMQEAVPVGTGAMAAIMGLPVDAVEAVVRDAAKGEVVEVANVNSTQQIVIAGDKRVVERAVALAGVRDCRAARRGRRRARRRGRGARRARHAAGGASERRHMANPRRATAPPGGVRELGVWGPSRGPQQA